MAWTAPITFVAGNPLTAAQLNAIQANLLETAVAKATATGQYPVATGTNALAMRRAATDVVNVTGTTTSTAYTNTLTSGGTGPTVTVTTGAYGAVFLMSYLANSTAAQSSFMSYDVSGAGTLGASDSRAILLAPGTTPTPVIKAGGLVQLHSSLTPGSNTFTAQYRVTGGSGTYDDRKLTVIPF